MKKIELEHFPKSVKRFSDKKCDKQMNLEPHSDSIRMGIALVCAAALIFCLSSYATAQQTRQTNTPKAAQSKAPPAKQQSPSQSDPRDKMRTLKNKEGKDYQTAWWKELTWCGGEMYSLSVHADRPKENMDAFRQNGNMIANYGVHRLVTDRGMEINPARLLASENFTNASRSKEMSYNLSNLLTPDLRKIDRDKTTEKTLAMCSQTLGDYAKEFPELFQKPAN